jgi:hypothetical protein
MAETALAAGPEHKLFPYFQFAKGLAEFRGARFAGAVQWLQGSLNPRGDAYRIVQAEATLAMTRHHLNQTGEARATLAQALEAAEHMPKFEQDSSPEDRTNDWIIAHLLLREAKALITGESSPN